MDRRERSGDFSTAMLAYQEGILSTVWTALPGIVVGFDPAKRTASIQPTLRAQVQKPDGSFYWVQMPQLLDCPVVFPGGGGVSLTFPLEPGDEVLVVFASRCIDAWWQSGGIQNQAELRMHDLSDGFAIPGPRSLPAVEAGGIATDAAELRTHSGTSLIRIHKMTGAISVVAAGNLNLQAAGNISITAGAGITLNGKDWDTHRHSGVQPGGGTSGGVV